MRSLRSLAAHTFGRGVNRSAFACGLLALVWSALFTPSLHAELKFTAFNAQGDLRISDTFTNGVCVLEKSTSLGQPWIPGQNFFTTNAQAEVRHRPAEKVAFLRAWAADLNSGPAGFSNLVKCYSSLSTIAGNGGSTAAINKWQASFEGRPATNALLSRPHIAMADDAGLIYIADKEGHGIRRINLDGTIVTVAGTSQAGNGPDSPTLATNSALRQPNGLWARRDGTVYILDLANQKIRKLDTNGMMSTLFNVPGLVIGRGIWVKDDESLAYVCSGTILKKWTPKEGVTDFVTGFSTLGNLAFDPSGRLYVTDHGAGRVYRINSDGSKTPFAGNGLSSDSPGGGPGGAALLTRLEQVRAIWFLPTGACFLGTENPGQLWYMDAAGSIFLFLNGSGSLNTHAGDGPYFFKPEELRLGVVKQITLDRDGNLLITENDAGYVRKVRFLKYSP